MRHSLLAVLLVLAGVAPVTAKPASAMPDPAQPGPYGVQIVEYDAGPTVVVGRGNEQWVDNLHGALFVPSGPGPYPVVLFLHGVGPRDCEQAITTDDVSLVCGVQQRTPNHRGYDYLATNLASHGYVVASVRLQSGSTGAGGGGLTDNGGYERAEFLARHLDLIAGWNTTPGGDVGNALLGKVDLTRIGAMGHSRGGEAVAALIEYLPTRTDGPTYHVGAVFAIAPIDSMTLAPHGVPYGVLLPMCDGDVVSMGGATAWDRGRFADPADPAPRVQFTVRGANHDWYNTVWEATGGDDAVNTQFPDQQDSACHPDSPTSVRLTAAAQRQTATATMLPFFRRYLGGETAFEPVLTGAAELPGIGTSYLAPAAGRRVLVSLGAADVPVSLAGFTATSVCDPAPEASGPACPSDPTRSAARQYTLTYDGPATLTANLGSYDAGRWTALTFRSGVNFPAYGTPAPAVDVVLRDADGHSASVTVAGTRGLTEPEGSLDRRLVLDGTRVPLASFRGVRLDRLAAVELHFGGNGAASVQLTELAFQSS